MPVTLKKKTATATETKQFKDSGQVVSEDSSETQVELPDTLKSSGASEGPWCEVGFEAGYTKNLGTMQFAKLGVTTRSAAVSLWLT